MKAPLDNSRSASKYVVKTAKVLDVFATGKAHITLPEESSVFQIPHCYLPTESHVAIPADTTALKFIEVIV